MSFFFRCELVNGNVLTSPEHPDIDPLNPEMISQPIWVSIEQLPEIELLPHINNNLMDYFKTGIFEPLFFEEPYENVARIVNLMENGENNHGKHTEPKTETALSYENPDGADR